MVNQRDVAKIARVSSATVSAVVNENKFVSKELKERVLKAIEKLDYEVNISARSLKSNNTNLVGFICDNVSHDFILNIIRGIDSVLNGYKYGLILFSAKSDPAEELKYLKILKSINVKNIILTPTGGCMDYIDKLIKEGTNIVQIDRVFRKDEDRFDVVLVDNVMGAYSGVKCLLDNGYKKIGIIDCFINYSTGKDRLKGYEQALREAGINIKQKYIKVCKFNERPIEEMVLELLNDEDKPDALFLANDNILISTLKVTKQLKIRIPEDIGIVCFDDINWFNATKPTITSIRQPLYQIGKNAIELILNRINNADNNLMEKGIIKVLDTKLIIRESSKRH